MEKKLLSGTDIYVSAIALGTDVYGLNLSEEESFLMIDAYLDMGGNVIDTAKIYSDWVPGEKSRSEKLIGRYLKSRGNRGKIVISTKGAHPEVGHMDSPRLSEADIRSDMEASLNHLGVDHVDIYWLHRDHKTADVAEIAETLDKLIKEGKTRYIGLSNWTGERIDEFNRYAAAHSLSKVIAGQIQYSAATAIKENNDPTLVLMDETEYAFYKENKMPVFAFAAQAKGFFQKMESGGEAALSEKACGRYLSDENRARFLRVKEVAASHGVSSGEAALASLICNPDFEVIPIVGCKNIAQLEDTVKAADLKLSTGETEYIKRG